MSKIQGITYEPPVREEFKMPTLEEMMAMMGGGPGGPGGPGEGVPPGGPSTPKTPVALKENGKLQMGELEKAPTIAGSIGESEAKAVYIESDDPDAGGITVSGEGEKYTVEDSTIFLHSNSNGLGGKGSGLFAGDHSEMTIRNCKVLTVGKARCCTATEQYSKMYIYNSYLHGHGAPFGAAAANLEDAGHPPAALEILGNCRTHCTQSNSETYLYDSTIIGDGWAALSTDGSEGYVKLEANNCKVQTILSGYGAYADGCCHDFFNSCDFDVADQAGIMAGECDMTFDDCTAVCGSYFAHIHCVMGMPSEVGTLTVRNSAVNSVKDAVSIRSQNAIVNIESSDITADNGVLVHSIVNTDPNATKTGGKRVYGIHVHLKDSELEGAILHEDPDREMNVYFEGASLVGAIQGAILHFDGESTWTATNQSSVTIVGEVDTDQIDAPAGVTIQAIGAKAGSFTLASGGMLVVKEG